MARKCQRSDFPIAAPSNVENTTKAFSACVKGASNSVRSIENASIEGFTFQISITITYSRNLTSNSLRFTWLSKAICSLTPYLVAPSPLPSLLLPVSWVVESSLKYQLIGWLIELLFKYLICCQGEVFPAGLGAGVALGGLARRHQPLHRRRDQHSGPGFGAVLRKQCSI